MQAKLQFVIALIFFGFNLTFMNTQQCVAVVKNPSSCVTQAYCDDYCSQFDCFSNNQCQCNPGNVALYKPADQSSLYTGSCYPASADKAVDNVDNGQWGACSCTHTTGLDSDPWWRVDLGQVYQVAKIYIHNREDCCPERLNNFKIHVGNDPTVENNPTCSGINFESWFNGAKNFSCTLYGRYVGIKLYGHVGPLTLCEVKVQPGNMLTIQDFGGYFAYGTNIFAGSCLEYYNNPNNGQRSGYYKIQVQNQPAKIVYCEQQLDGGGWTTWIKRTRAGVDFHQGWYAYVNGFGGDASVLAGDDYWLGLENLYYMTNNHKVQLRIDMQDNSYSYPGLVKYSQFYVNSASDKYRLYVTGCTYSGVNADGLSGHSGYQFTTTDYDNDVCSVNCANSYTGGFWYTCCHAVHPTGQYGNNNYGMGVGYYYYGNTHYNSLETNYYRLR